MKINKLKLSSIAIFSFVFSLSSQTQCMERENNNKKSSSISQEHNKNVGKNKKRSVETNDTNIVNKKKKVSNNNKKSSSISQEHNKNVGKNKKRKVSNFSRYAPMVALGVGGIVIIGGIIYLAPLLPAMEGGLALAYQGGTQIQVAGLIATGTTIGTQLLNRLLK